MSETLPSASPPSDGLTGFILGEGGIPSVSLGVREPLLFRAPGTGGRRRGAGEDMVLLLLLLLWSRPGWGWFECKASASVCEQ